MVCKQAIAIFAMESISLAASLVGSESHWSNTSFNSRSRIVIIGDDRDEMRSLGCLPMIISKVNTPKLNTSHFSLTSIVYASSDKKMS